MDIHNAGGGIHSTVQSILKASEDELYTLFKSRLLQLLKSGPFIRLRIDFIRLKTYLLFKYVTIFHRGRQF